MNILGQCMPFRHLEASWAQFFEMQVFPVDRWPTLSFQKYFPTSHHLFLSYLTRLLSLSWSSNSEASSFQSLQRQAIPTVLLLQAKNRELMIYESYDMLYCFCMLFVYKQHFLAVWDSEAEQSLWIIMHAQSFHVIQVSLQAWPEAASKSELVSPASSVWSCQLPSSVNFSTWIDHAIYKSELWAFSMTQTPAAPW